jgi:DNA polymerase III epsilon subunit-like protein
MPGGLLDRRIAETPIAVVDFKTTGHSPGQDRVVEVSVVRIDPGQPAKPVLNSIVKPNRKIAGTEIHGLTDADVTGAPTFAELASDFLMSISGCVVAAYNASVQVGFMQYELGQMGVHSATPHLCLMYMQPLLGMGERCALSVACQRLGINYAAKHHAAEDSWAGAQLFDRYSTRMRELGIETFGQLRKDKSYPFLESLVNEPAEWSLVTGNYPHKQRVMRPQPLHSASQNPAEYWHALTAAVSDLKISDAEVFELTDLRQRLKLSDDYLRMFHARLYASVLRQFIDDQCLDIKEARKLHLLTECLRRLGWAPGD